MWIKLIYWLFDASLGLFFCIWVCSLEFSMDYFVHSTLIIQITKCPAFFKELKNLNLKDLKTVVRQSEYRLLEYSMFLSQASSAVLLILNLLYFLNK